jgi:hypothetical protein
VSSADTLGPSTVSDECESTPPSLSPPAPPLPCSTSPADAGRFSCHKLAKHSVFVFLASDKNQAGAGVILHTKVLVWPSSAEPPLVLCAPIESNLLMRAVRQQGVCGATAGGLQPRTTSQPSPSLRFTDLGYAAPYTGIRGQGSEGRRVGVERETGQGEAGAHKCGTTGFILVSDHRGRRDARTPRARCAVCPRQHAYATQDDGAADAGGHSAGGARQHHHGRGGAPVQQAGQPTR